MAKAIHNHSTWYQEVSPDSFYTEEDLERALVHNLEIIFPEFQVIPFKLSLSQKGGQTNKPDLSMIKKDYTEWYIIEVELGHHSLDHVIEQIDTFYNAEFPNPDKINSISDYMHKNSDKSLDITSLKNMIKNIPYNLMVIVNQEKDDWRDALKGYNCKVCVFQIYHSISGDKIYRLSGDHPFIYTNFCHCIYDKKKNPFMVEVLDKNFLNSYGYSSNQTINILYEDKSFAWKVITSKSGDRVFLHNYSSHSPLDSLSKRYKLNYNSELKIFSFTKD